MDKPLRKTDARKPIYKLVETISGRELTTAEHDDLKKLVIEYGQNEAAFNEENLRVIQKQKKRLKSMGRMLFNIARKKGINIEDIKFLEQVFEQTI